MTVIIDYGVGNLFSLEASFSYIGEKAVVSGDPDILRKADRLVLPGVGAFGDAIGKLRASGLDSVIINEAKTGKNLLGICLGMQLLFSESYEFGTHKGLGILNGRVVPIKEHIHGSLKIPHIGWNSIEKTRDSEILKYVNSGEQVYFVHSYHAIDCEDSLVAVTEYGVNLTAAVESGNVMGCQFHPEKSGRTGLNILKAFIER